MSHVDLRSGNGERLARSSLDLRELRRLFSRLPDELHCLGYVDPYGYTVFNKFQSGTVLDELAALEQTCRPQEVKEFIEPIRQWAQQVRDGTHLYLWFVGD